MSTALTSRRPFPGRGRKIVPFEIPDHPGPDASYETLARYAVEKAASLNWQVIGFGDLAEGEWKALRLEAPDLDRMRQYRLARVRAQLAQHDLAGVLLFDPVNIRYATDAPNMQVWCMHNAVRYAWVPTEGPVLLWDFHNCEHLSRHLSLVAEVRPATAWYYFGAGPRYDELARRWAAEIADAAKPAGRRIAVDHLNPEGVEALAAHGITVCNGEEIVERARAVKSEDEIRAMRRAIAGCESAMAAMERSLVPGMTETDLWAVLHAESIRRGGEWIETRLLASGPRTNPWFQECSSRVIEAGDLVGFDTDLVGAYGYCCDISRTWLAGEGRPTAEQRRLYTMAGEQIAANIPLLAPGVTFRELGEKAQSLPSEYLPNRYSVLFHGVGLCDEYPSIYYQEDFAGSGYDGVLEPNMVLCVESYVGRHGGHEGVKLEEQVLITEKGHEILSRYPLDPRLSAPGR